jgi:ligand-binding sensor domain-containing protein
VWELALGRCRRLRALPLTSLALDSRGELWIGTRDRGLFRHAGGRWGRYLAGRHLPAAGVNCLLEDVRGLLWIGTDDGLGLFDRPQWLTVVRGWDVVRLDPAPGGVWACYQEGAVRFQGFHVVEKIRPDDLPSPPVSLVHLTSGLLWAATREHGLWLRDPGGEWSRARLGRGLAGVVRLVPDHAQGIWLLCRDGGLWHAPAQGEPVPYGPEQGLPEEDILEMGWWPLPAAALPGPPEG